MYTKQSKKMLPFIVLDVLNKYTDSNHRLSQKDIEKILADQYDMIVDRRSVKSSIMDLLEIGCDIQYREILRTVKDKQTGENDEQSIYTDFYIERDFSDCEIRLLIDELLDTNYIPAFQRKQLISKLESLSSVYFRKRVSSHKSEDYRYSNNQFFYSMDVIDEAITSLNKVSFKYKSYGIGKSNRLESNIEFYTVTPYEMKVHEGKYLLLCSEDDINEICLRIDFISDISIIHEKGRRKPRKPHDSKNQMMKVIFQTTDDMIQTFVDEFGPASIQVDRNGKDIKLCVEILEKIAVEFSIIYSNFVTVLYPENIRSIVMSRLQRGMDRYDMIS